MHDEKEGSENPGEFLHPGDAHYREMLRKIVDAVEKTLRRFPGAGDENVKKKGEEDEPPVAAADAIRIFIADTADTLQNTREKLINALKEKGVYILPKISLSLGIEGYKTEVKKAVDDAHLVVHLLDSCPGRKIEDSNSLTYPRVQVEIGQLSHTPQLVWIPKDLEYKDIEVSDYADFLESLDRGPRQKTNFEFILDERINLPHLVLQKIKSIRQQHVVNKDDKNAQILLDTQEKDQHFAFKLAAYLTSKNIKIQFNSEYRDPASALLNFEKALEYACGLVIIYGAADPQSILERLKIIIKLVCKQMIESYKTSLKNRWICMLPSSRLTPEIDNMAKELQIKLLDNRHSDKPDQKALKPLLKYCNAGGTE